MTLLRNGLISGFFFIFTSASLFAESEVAANAFSPVPANFHYDVIYQFDEELQYIGPSGWVGMIQQRTEEGKPIYILPPQDDAVYLKYNPKNAGQGRTSSPIIQVQVYKNNDKQSAKSFLERITSKLPKKTSAKDIKLKNRPAAVAEFNIEYEENGAKTSYPRKVYVMNLSDMIFLIQLTSFESEYAEDVKVFDETVQGIKLKGEFEKISPRDPHRPRMISFNTEDGNLKTMRVFSETKDEYIVSEPNGRFSKISKEKAKLLP